MIVNPVFLNELRQSPIRRKPAQAFILWALATTFLMWLTQYLAGAPYALTWLPMFALPIIVPGFAAGTFAKEYEQQTWQDLYLTRLTNFQVVTGKFGAALLQVWILLLSFLPAMTLMLVNEGKEWARTPGWWTIVLMFKLLLSASLYVLLAMVCSRYSSNRRTALIFSYTALFLYALMGAAVWSLVGQTVADAERAETVVTFVNGVLQTQSQVSDPVSPGFMGGIHLIFCSVVGAGSLVLLWVSMSEQRGYNKDNKETMNRAWQPIANRRQSETAT